MSYFYLRVDRNLIGTRVVQRFIKIILVFRKFSFREIILFRVQDRIWIYSQISIYSKKSLWFDNMTNSIIYLTLANFAKRQLNVLKTQFMVPVFFVTTVHGGNLCLFCNSWFHIWRRWSPPFYHYWWNKSWRRSMMLLKK